MSDPPGMTRASSMPSSSSGASATASSGGRSRHSPPARCTASAYLRGLRLESSSHFPQLARSIAAQMPMTGLISLETLEAAELLPVSDRGLEGLELDPRPVEVVVDHVLAERLAGDRGVGEQVARRVDVVRNLGLVGVVGVALERRLELELVV